MAPTYVADVEGTPEMIFGCSATDAAPTVGIPWMLGTPVIVSPKWRMTFLRETRRAVEAWQAEYPILHNFIDARNTVHMRWLRWLGFTFIALDETHGPFGLPFYEFVRINPCVTEHPHSPPAPS